MNTAALRTRFSRPATLLVALLLLRPALAPAAGYENTEPGEARAAFVTGDALQVGVPLVGLALTYFLNDPGASAGSSAWAGHDLLSPLTLDGNPRHDFLAAGLRMELVTQTLKFGVDEQRPNGGSHSFPSGHTATAFMGAEFIRKEYGWGWGAPAYLAASYVGWSRVASQNHYTHDVLAGALIGILSNHDLDSISLPFGSLTVGPAMLEAPSTNLPGRDAAPATPAGMGLKFRLEFGGR